MSRRAVVIIQARMTSTRLPGKVLLPLGSATVLDSVLRRAARVPGVELVCVAVPEGVAHEPIVDVVRSYPEVAVTRGPEGDVLGRYAMAAKRVGADFVVRITSDCPLIDPAISGSVLAAAVATDGYARTNVETGYPHGLDTEALPVRLLEEADIEATEAFDREHVTPFIWRQPQRFPAVYLDRRPDRRDWRLTLDTPADYELMIRLWPLLGDAPEQCSFPTLERVLRERPELLAINRTGSSRGAMPGWPPAGSPRRETT